MTTYRFGPLQLTLETRELEEVLTGLRVALRRRRTPIDADRIPEGWHLQQRRGKPRPWPSRWTRRTGYWLSIWCDHRLGAHITIKPDRGSWRVEYDAENRWTGGSTLGYDFSFDEAVEVALDAAERVNDGATERELRFEYRDWGG